MPNTVDAKHRDYQKYLSQWSKCRVASDGEDEVKALAMTLLPKPSGLTDDEYKAYKERAMFFGATHRTLQGLVGAIFRKPAKLVPPKGVDTFFEDLMPDDTQFEVALKKSAVEVLKVGRQGLLLDMAPTGGTFPYIVSYCAESIINWSWRMVDGEWELTLVVLQESVEQVKADDPFVFQKVPRWRVLELVRNTPESAPFYRQSIWIKQKQETTSGSTENFVMEGDYTIPTKLGGGTLDYIPFVFLNPMSISHDIEKPPLADLVAVNISHYRSSADLEHGRHLTALPTPWVSGVDPATTTLTLGSTRAWAIKNPEAKAGFLEFSGAGLASLAIALETKEKLMAVLGARLLEQQQPSVEAAAGAQTRMLGEHSILAAVAGTIGYGYEILCYWACEWMGIPDGEDVQIELNNDFGTAHMSEGMLTALMGAYQGGTISWDTFIYNLARGEILPDGRTPEQERELIDAAGAGNIVMSDMELDSLAEKLAGRAAAKADPNNLDAGGNNDPTQDDPNANKGKGKK